MGEAFRSLTIQLFMIQIEADIADKSKHSLSPNEVDREDGLLLSSSKAVTLKMIVFSRIYTLDIILCEGS